MSAMNFLDEIAWRGLLYQTAGQGVEEHLQTPGRTGYCGFDPTRESLTIGNFMPIKMLMHWQRAGHRPIVLMGGGTGLIGDPSGKDSERQLQTREQVAHNVAQQKTIMERFLDFGEGGDTGAILVNNLDWLSKVSYLDMLRDVGKHFSVNMMIQKDSVRDRLENRDQGISYTEFSYMILQAYDFWHLRKHHGCTVQVAGSDQYGNIVAGMDLIRRMEGHETESFGVTNPLVTNADGSKIGKSEDGAIWLSPELTSPYRFYQWWINAADENVLQYLRWFTFLEKERVEELDAEHAKAPHQRPAQKALAEHMTELVHGKSELDRAIQASQALFSGDVKALDARMLAEVFADVPHSEHPKSALGGDGASLVELLPETTLVKSKREAREFLGNGAVSVNGEKAGADAVLRVDDLLPGDTILLRRGKKAWHATRWA